MTDKQFVKSLYPHAWVDSEYVTGYSTYRLEPNTQLYVMTGNDAREVWKRLKENIELEMIRKLAS